MSWDFEKPRIVILGGADVDSRLDLMKSLEGDFDLIAIGSNKQLRQRFMESGFGYYEYVLSRQINPIRDLISLVQLFIIFRRLKPQVVHTFDTKPGVWGRLAARMAHVPIVIGTLPGLGSLYSENNLRTRMVRSVYQPLQKLACSISDLTIFQNQEDADQFVLAGIVSRHKTAILNGSGVQTQVYDPQMFSLEQRRQVRASLGLDDTKILIVMISRIIRSKGVLEFAQAAKFIRKQNPHTVFLLVGSDDYQSADVLTCDERDLIAKSVTCLGARNDVPELLSISNIFVLPTFYREGIPRVLLEAASMGLPIIATSVPGCKEVVEQNINGLLVPARDVEKLKQAIKTLIVEPLLCRQFGQASRQRAITYFDLSIIVGQTAAIYKQLLTQNGDRKV
jgi:glycosyltransferase involved in cell wall biosynthesis